MTLSPYDHAVRSTGIGASEAWRVVLNEGALAVYERLVHPDTPPITRTLAMREGSYLEPLIREMYSERFRVEVSGAQRTERHRRFPFILATLDGVRADDERIVEIKRPKWMNAEQWGPDGSQQFPQKYRIQCAVQMAVFECDRCDLVAYPEGDDAIRVYPLSRDIELEGLILDALVGFWTRHVEARDPPAPDGTSEAAAYIKRRFPRDRLPLVDPDPETETLAREMSRLRKERKTIEARESELENTLKMRCGEAAGMKGLFTWKIEGDGEGPVAWKALAHELGATSEQITQFRAARARTFRLSRKLEG